MKVMMVSSRSGGGIVVFISRAVVNTIFLYWLLIENYFDDFVTGYGNLRTGMNHRARPSWPLFSQQAILTKYPPGILHPSRIGLLISLMCVDWSL